MKLLNRSGVIALSIAAAIVLWGYLHRDEDSPPKPHAAHRASREIRDGGFDGS